MFGDGDDDDAEEGIEFEEDDQDEVYLSSGEDGADKEHDVDDISINDDEYG